MIKTLFIVQFIFFCVYGSVFGITINEVRVQTENRLMAQIPDSTYTQLPIELLLKVPVQ